MVGPLSGDWQPTLINYAQCGQRLYLYSSPIPPSQTPRTNNAGSLLVLCSKNKALPWGQICWRPILANSRAPRRLTALSSKLRVKYREGVLKNRAQTYTPLA